MIVCINVHFCSLIENYFGVIPIPKALADNSPTICVYSKYYKWKNHFSGMKGDVGMSPHEKEGEQKDA